MPKTKKKAQREYHYFRVVITYIDGETSGHKIYHDRTKAEKWAERQNLSPMVKKATVEPFVRNPYAASKVRKPRKTGG